MRYFPIFIDLKHQKVMVIGGGETAAQKVRLLLKTDAKITVVATDLTAELHGLAKTGRISTLGRNFKPTDLTSARLIYAASGNRGVDRAVSSAAQRLNIPVNVVDDQDACSFITPAIVDRAPVVIAVSSEGSAPVLAREIKSKLEAMLPANFGALARFAASLRPMIAKRITHPHTRRSFWQRFFKSRARNLVLQGRENEAMRATSKEIEYCLNDISQTGRVSLTGVGPGNPDLLTLKAQQRLQEADVIVLDGLVNPDILEYARRDAARIYVGRTPGQACIKQSEINAVMARYALDGQQVLRLQGGDHLHFSRDIAELNVLTQLGIETEVIPGVNSPPPCSTRIPATRIPATAPAAKG